ncbi:MAG: hypothetical protein DRO52_03905 [Candidatus Hecatellales archaeon]|nr:MAG: hypothetical protein DRO52_03905 [Candidatus Hecatellales archaeon]
MAFLVAIDKNACSNCKICLDTCEKGVFAVNSKGEIYVSNPSNCVGCWKCFNSCLCNAILIRPKG